MESLMELFEVSIEHEADVIAIGGDVWNPGDGSRLTMLTKSEAFFAKLVLPYGALTLVQLV